MCSMEETVFQKIIAGEIPANIVYETDATLAFLDIEPVNKGHTLVIPKTPVKDIYDLTDTDAADLMQSIVVVANAVRQATGASGINIISNNGAEAGQKVFHLHFHVIPRFNRSEFPKLPHSAYANDAEREDIAQAIADAGQF